MSQTPALFEDDQIADVPAKWATDALAAWNETAAKVGWPTARFLTEARRRALKRALKDYGSLVGFRANLEKAARSSFLTGKTTRDEKHAAWRPDLDWFIKPSTVVKILEDKYVDQAERQATPMSLSRQMDPTDQWGRWLRDYKLKSFWPSHLGPRPEAHDCRAPKGMLEACRERLGIVASAPVVETREERLAGSIVLHRKYGRYDRANALEEELARLEGRPPVLVPSPDARDPDVVPPVQSAAESAAKARPKRDHRAFNTQVTDVIDVYDGDIPEGDPDTWADR
jgi:hypothetical protein